MLPDMVENGSGVAGSSGPGLNESTLDEPVWATIWRDVSLPAPMLAHHELMPDVSRAEHTSMKWRVRLTLTSALVRTRA